MKRRLLPFACFLLLTHLSFAQVIYVDSAATGANTGATWPDAYTDLKAALNAAADGDEIWVTKGTYKPDTMNGNAASTFLINKNLLLLGGFDGTETSVDERDPDMNETILSGDLNGDDVDDNFNDFKSDNIMTVVTIISNITNETWIDGFTIKGGYADGTGGFDTPEENGGAIYSNGSPTIRHCIFLQNYAFAGGGAIMHPPGAGQATIIDKCTFVKNMATFGGAVAFPWADFNISDCLFLRNSTFAGTPLQDPDGGAVAVYANQASNGGIVQDCVFSENHAAGYGGGIYCWSTSSSTGVQFELKDCIFENNISTTGGGGAILTLRGNLPAAFVTGCAFTENTSIEGGAMILRSDAISSANFLVEDCLIDGNTANLAGGGISLNTSSPDCHATISRTTIINNQSPDGGAVDQYHYYSINSLPLGASVVFDNCLIAGNVSENASISMQEFPNLTLFNCTVADNTGGGIELAFQSGITLQNTVLANPNFTEYLALTTDVAVTSNGGNLVLDASLNDHLNTLDKPETEPGFEPGTYEPSSTSPLINAGINDGVAAGLDIAGNPRIQGGSVDIGAYESSITATWEVLMGGLELWPNPTSDYLNIHLPQNMAGFSKLSIFDAQGRLVAQIQGRDNQTIKVGGLPSGTYTLKAVDKYQVYSGIFQKQ